MSIHLGGGAVRSFGMKVPYTSLAVATMLFAVPPPVALAQPPVVVVQQADPQATPTPIPPAQYGGAQNGTYTAPDGTTWVPVPSGYRLVLEPEGQPQTAPYVVAAPAPSMFDLERRIDRTVRRARRAGFIQIAAAGLTLIAVSGALACEAEGRYCPDWWGVAALGFVGFSGAGIVSAFSANRASGLLEQSGVPIRRGAGRWAVALSFVPYVNIGAFALTTVQLGRVRRARAMQATAAPQPVYVPYGTYPAPR